MIKTVCHIVTGLRRGGAETLLARLVTEENSSGLKHVVVCLGGVAEVSSTLIEHKVPLCHLALHDLRLLRSMRVLRNFLSEHKPELFQSWLYHANLFTLLILCISKAKPIVWSIHNNYDLSGMKKLTKVVVKLNQWLSFLAPKHVIYCSNSAMTSHLDRGFSKSNAVSITNGINTTLFQKMDRIECLSKLNLNPNRRYIGMVARNSPEKNYKTFLDAAWQLTNIRNDTDFILCGHGVLDRNIEESILNLQLKDRIHKYEKFSELAVLYNACDILALTSTSEAFGLVVGEAMACEKSVTVSKIAGLEELVGVNNPHISALDSKGFAKAWQNILELPPHALEARGHENRLRIQENYSWQAMLEKYREVWINT